MNKQESIELGAHGIAIKEKDLRPVSLEFLRGGGTPVGTMPVRLHVYPNCAPVINDGRHRIFMAREKGATHVPGKIVGYGPRGGQLWSYTGKVRV
jgi:hypothetical protein